MQYLTLLPEPISEFTPLLEIREAKLCRLRNAICGPTPSILQGVEPILGIGRVYSNIAAATSS